MLHLLHGALSEEIDFRQSEHGVLIISRCQAVALDKQFRKWHPSPFPIVRAALEKLLCRSGVLEYFFACVPPKPHNTILASILNANSYLRS